MESSESLCCEFCFEHAWLRALAKEKQAAQGCCFYCGTSAALTPLSIFRRGFANLLSDYIPAEHANGGRDSYLPSVPTLEAVQRDWKVFSVQCQPERLERFLPSLFKDDGGSPVRDFQAPVVPFHRNAMSTGFSRWQEFVTTGPVSYVAWPSEPEPIDLETIGSYPNQHAEHLRPFVRTLLPDWRLWRARGNYAGSSKWDCQPLPQSQVANNPKCPASRLNRDGEIVLYTAEAERTAIAEIRPGRGYLCTTCELKTKRSLDVLDLASPLEEVNPFTQENLSWHLDLQRIARHVGNQIAQPVSRGEDAVVYNKTQYLAMISRAMKLDGIRFSSSLDTPDGVNLALFDPEIVDYSMPRLVEITNNRISYEALEPSTFTNGA